MIAERSLEDRTWRQERADVVAKLRSLAEEKRAWAAKARRCAADGISLVGGAVCQAEDYALALDNMADGFQIGFHVGADDEVPK